MDTSNKDEVRVIIALGVVAIILTYLQIKGSNAGGIIPIQQLVAIPFVVSAISSTVYFTLFLFAFYILLLALALGMDGWYQESWGANVLKDFADIYFGIASAFLAIIGILTFVFLFVETPTGGTAIGSLAGYFVSEILFTSVAALILFALFKDNKY
ncbi:MAG: hypothetical protein JRN68_00060 [Nitrososphaerota archaeon]|nr:hypothetical protein [Nitrososphaerota archaeon]